MNRPARKSVADDGSSATPSPYEYPAKVRYDETKIKQHKQRYLERRTGRHRAELRMLQRALALIPKSHRILDAPCGWGRLTVELVRKGYEVTGADLSESMLQAARETLNRNQMSCVIEWQDLEQLTYGDRSFDTIICFRLFHHLPHADVRRCIVDELCRVADRFVVISYLSPVSVTAIRRKLRERLLGKRIARYYTPLAELKVYFGDAGFTLIEDIARIRYLTGLHVAVFERAIE